MRKVPDKRLAQALAGLTIVAAVVTAYIPALHAGFVWDDEVYSVDNPDVKLPGRFGQLWTGEQATVLQYYPLTTSSFWLEYRLWGASPRGYHVTNILLHALGALLVWLLLRRMAIPGAWLAAMLFALHPVGAATVSWIAERKNVLSLALGLLFLLSFLRFETGRRRRWYAVALALFTAALLSKTAIAPLPLVLLLWAWWSRGRIVRRDLALVAPFLLIAAGLAVVTIRFESALTRESHLAIPPLSRLALVGRTTWFYLAKAALPANLTVVYPRWPVDPGNPLLFAPLLALFALAAALIRLRRRGWARAALFALGAYVVMLLPVSGLVGINLMTMTWVADHWQYASLIAFCALAAAFAAYVARRGPRARNATAAVATAVLVLFFVQTRSRAREYTSELTLWTDNIAKNPQAFVAYDGRGYCYERAGDLDRALSDYDRAIELNPAYPDAYNNRGNVFLRQGKPEKALADYDKAIALNPTYVGSYNDRASLYARTGRLELALADYDQAIGLDPLRSEFYAGRASVYSRTGEYEKALADYTRALELKPKDPTLYYNRANASLRAGQVERAVADYTEALRLRPDYAEAVYNRSHAYYQLGKYGEALADLNAAGRLGHNVPEDYLAELSRLTGSGR